MNDKLLIKASGAVAIENKLSVNQRKIWNILLENATPSFRSGATSFEINSKDLIAAAVKENYTVSDLESDLKDLVTTLVMFNVLGKDKRDWGGAAAVLSGYTINYSTGEITYGWDERMLLLLVVQTGNDVAPYVKLDTTKIRQLNSKHELALIELFMDYYDTKRPTSETRWIRIPEFQQLMGTNYDNWRDLKKRVIDNPLEELRRGENNLMDFDVTYETKKGLKRQVVEIKFKFTKKQKMIGTAPLEEQLKIDYDGIFAAQKKETQEKIMAEARKESAYILRLADEEPEKYGLKAEATLITARNIIVKNLIDRSKKNG